MKKRPVLSEKEYHDALYARNPKDAFENTPSLKRCTTLIFQRVVDGIQPKKSDHILSLGCANGRMELKFAPLVKTITGVDISSQAIANAKQAAKEVGAKNVSFSVQDITEKLPFKDGSFDKILALGTFHHLRKIDKALSEISRVLKEGGILCSIDPNANGILRIIGQKIFKRIYQIGHSPQEYNIKPRELIKKNLQVGLKIKTLKFLDFLSSPVAFLWAGLPLPLFNLLICFDRIWCATPAIRGSSSSFILICRKPGKNLNKNV